ncbi:MAG TPA: bifunctional phosphoglucose/phosphomannose isomerase [Candidatus Limnocylindria bacterium]|nr:bifunctional phosphoglucose/phosphomannose isomerase [Candidatus Limnocylindria bacterium]
MSALEPPFGGLDRGGMAARIERIPDHIDDALARLAAYPWRLQARMPSLLALGAMGGSAIAGELTAGLYADRTPRPLLVVREDHWPACVTREAFALLCSYSGNTAETLALYQEAARRQVPRAAMTTGGALAVACDRDAVPWAKLPGGSPPRAALFSAWVTVTHLIAALDWADDPAADWREAAELLRERNATLGPSVPEARNPAKQLVRALAGRLVVIYSGTERTAAAASRMRQQINENAKLLGHSAVVPELNHNEIVAWERPGPVSGSAAVVLLRDREDSADTAQRLSLTAEFAARQGASVHEIGSVGHGRLARLASLVQFGDYVSLYLAFVTGVDPSPVASIDEFKRRLSGAEQA